jgi:hypothetical protein
MVLFDGSLCHISSAAKGHKPTPILELHTPPFWQVGARDCEKTALESAKMQPTMKATLPHVPATRSTASMDDSSDDEDSGSARRYDHLLAPIIVFWWSPVFLLCPRFEALMGCVASAIGAFSVGLAVFALQSHRTAARLRTVPPVAKCVVAGLLTGLGLLVMVPSALDLRPPGFPVAHLLLVFCAAPVGMYLIHHVVLEHQHQPGGSCGPHLIQVDAKGKGPAAFITSGTLKFNSSPAFCVSTKQAAKVPACGGNTPSKCGKAPQRANDVSLGLLEAGTTPETREALVACTSVLLRAVPYTLHASIDGAVLATATSLRMLTSLALPIALCAVQDVGTLLVALTACRASHRAKLIISGCFGLGFPLGASVALALGTLSSSSSADLALVRAFAGGLFVYMALFELAPPHAPDRRTHLRYVLGFVAGLVVVALSEDLELQLAAPASWSARDGDPAAAAAHAVVTSRDEPAPLVAASALPSSIAAGFASSFTALAVPNVAGARVAAARLFARLPETAVEEPAFEPAPSSQAPGAPEAARGRRRPVTLSLLPSSA